MHEVENYRGAYGQDRYQLAMKTDRPLGAERPMFFVPGAGQMELAGKAQKWTQWGPFLIVDEYMGWYREALQLRETVVIGDWSPICKFNISGPDVHQFMRFLQTRKDFADIEVGQSMYTVMAREDGKVVQDPLITRVSEDAYMITTDQIDSWLQHVIEVGNFDVQVDRHSHPVLPDVDPGTELHRADERRRREFDGEPPLLPAAGHRDRRHTV